MKPFSQGILLGLAILSVLAQPNLAKAQEAPPSHREAVTIHDQILARELPQTGKPHPFLAFGSPQGIHFSYDPNSLTMRGIWTGTFGWQDDSKNFTLNESDSLSFSLHKFPWSYGEKKRRVLTHQWHGYEIRKGKVWLRYQLNDQKSGMSWEVEESLTVISEDIQRIDFHIQSNKKSDLYLNYWVTQTDFRRLSSNGQPTQRNKLKNLFPNQQHFQLTFVRRKKTPTIPHGYSVEAIDIPHPRKPFQFEPTNIDFANNGDVYVSTRNGQVWKCHGKTWTLFADGLHEANGIRVSPDSSGVYVMQKPELTLLQDSDEDGVADLYKTIENRFRFSGHYHEFAYGPCINSQGDLFFSTGLASHGYHLADPKRKRNQMSSALGYRGWVIKHNKKGQMIPFACGLRSPAGIGINAKDELFVTDNQGDWVASSYLTHVEEGDFLGHPASLWDRPEFGLTPRTLDYSTVAKIPKSVPKLDRKKIDQWHKPPAVWLAHGDLTNSPGHPSFAPESGFGPFAGQAFIADIAHRNVVRVALEKVGGHYQGAVFPFIRPLQSASYSSAFDAKGNLWIGSVGRGWTAGDPAIEVIRFDPTQKPFEIHRIELTKTGFDIHFTEALSAQAVPPSDILVNEYRYRYWGGYGSEPIDEKTVPVKHSKLSADRLTLSIEVALKKGFIFQIQVPRLKSNTGLTLDNNYGIYTLNQLRP